MPFAVLTGMAFAGADHGMDVDAGAGGDQSFPAIMRFGIVPMFLFAGAFYPIDQLPDWLQPAAYVTPLYHGVELCRAPCSARSASPTPRPRRRAAGLLVAGYSPPRTFAEAAGDGVHRRSRPCWPLTRWRSIARITRTVRP